MVEPHMAPGYLLASFLSPLTNQCSDELLCLGRTRSGEQELQWGFFNALVAPELATEVAAGPAFAKRHHEANAARGLEHDDRQGARG